MGRVGRAAVAVAITIGVGVAAAGPATADPVGPRPSTGNAAEQGATTAANRPGSSRVRMGTCKYDVRGPVGSLRTVVYPPSVKAPNLRAGVVDNGWARYYAVLVNANTGAAIQTTGWSDWLRTSDARYRTWSGVTTFGRFDWRGNYRVMVKIEWWSQTRRLGQRWRTYTQWGYIDQFNVGPYGPFSSCYKPTNPGFVIVHDVPPWF